MQTIGGVTLVARHVHGMPSHSSTVFQHDSQLMLMKSLAQEMSRRNCSAANFLASWNEFHGKEMACELIPQPMML